MTKPLKRSFVKQILLCAVCLCLLLSGVIPVSAAIVIDGRAGNAEWFGVQTRSLFRTAQDSLCGIAEATLRYKLSAETVDFALTAHEPGASELGFSGFELYISGFRVAWWQQNGGYSYDSSRFAFSGAMQFLDTAQGDYSGEFRLECKTAQALASLQGLEIRLIDSSGTPSQLLSAPIAEVVPASPIQAITEPPTTARTTTERTTTEKTTKETTTKETTTKTTTTKTTTTKAPATWAGATISRTTAKTAKTTASSASVSQGSQSVERTTVSSTTKFVPQYVYTSAAPADSALAGNPRAAAENEEEVWTAPPIVTLGNGESANLFSDAAAGSAAKRQTSPLLVLCIVVLLCLAGGCLFLYLRKVRQEKQW
ncbi:MAG: hypothetical protein LBR73_02275 [Oscillospiraceae bacterium]|jgi:hypothetical protein|nr:hypothetical protein [Oscillospiraceae bacterium]